MILVCPLSRVEETVVSSGAERLISLLSAPAVLTRPAAIAEANHLWLSLHDIVEARDGLTLPGEAHVAAIVAFAHAWDRRRPLVVHCYAGISRSTATAMIVAATLAPQRDEFELAQTLRRASPSATPNVRLLTLADALLGRDGRLVEAGRSIGRGADAFEGVPFALAI